MRLWVRAPVDLHELVAPAPNAARGTFFGLFGLARRDPPMIGYLVDERLRPWPLIDLADDLGTDVRTLRKHLVQLGELGLVVGPGGGPYLIPEVASIEGVDPSLPLAPPARPGRFRDPIPRRLAKQVFERDAYRCRICGSWEDLQADHIIPWSRGGPTTLENLQTLCGRCNNAKGARLP